MPRWDELALIAAGLMLFAVAAYIVVKVAAS
jgi:hypothetical protein